MVSGQAAQRHPTGPAIDVQDVGELAGDQTDVGLRPAPPPGQLGRVAAGVLQAVLGQGMLADCPTGRVATRAAHR